MRSIDTCVIALFLQTVCTHEKESEQMIMFLKSKNKYQDKKNLLIFFKIDKNSRKYNDKSKKTKHILYQVTLLLLFFSFSSIFVL